MPGYAAHDHHKDQYNDHQKSQIEQRLLHPALAGRKKPVVIARFLDKDRKLPDAHLLASEIFVLARNWGTSARPPWLQTNHHNSILQRFPWNNVPKNVEWGSITQRDKTIFPVRELEGSKVWFYLDYVHIKLKFLFYLPQIKVWCLLWS